MKFMSFLQFFGKRWLRGKPRRTRLSPAPARARLLLDELERRVMLAAPPTIVGVTPPNNATVTTLSPQPTISVTFSEAMAGMNAVGNTPGTGAANPNNYLLVDASGDTITIGSATLNVTDTIVTLGYNGGNDLPANTYTLFVRGNNLFDKVNSLPLAQNAQAFVANGGDLNNFGTRQNNVAVVNLGYPAVGSTGVTDGTLGATSNYPLPEVAGAPSSPWGVTHADLNGDGLPDLIIADNDTEQLLIFAGRPTAKGGGFDLTPNLILPLPASTGGAPGKSIIVDDFKNANPNMLPKIDILPDIAVANSDSNSVTIFLNKRSLNSVGTLAFSSKTVSLVGLIPAPGSPTGIVAGDFDNDGFQDIAMVVGNAGAATKTVYRYVQLHNFSVNGVNGNFTGVPATGFAIAYPVGDSGDSSLNPPRPSEGLQQPTSIALGDFNNDGLPDLVIGGSNGVAIEHDIPNKGVNVSFDNVAFPFLFGSTVITFNGLTATSMAAGAIAVKGTSGPAGPFTKGFNDIAVALTGQAPGNEIAILANDHSGTAGGGFTTSTTAPATLPLTINNFSQITLADLNGDGFNDIIFDDAHHSLVVPAPGNIGHVYALKNVSGTAGALVEFPNSPYTTDGDPTGVDVLDTTNDGIPGIADITIPNPLPPVQLVTVNTSPLGQKDFTLLLSNNDGTFRVPTILPSNPALSLAPPLAAIAVGDLNGDGIPDIAVVNSGLTAQQTQIEVMLGIANGQGQPSGMFTDPTAYNVNNTVNDFNRVVSIGIGALHAGGLPDIIVASAEKNEIEVLTNHLAAGDTSLTAGSFTAGTPVAVGTAPTQLVVGDFNKDGKLDVAVSHRSVSGAATNRGVTMLLGNANGTFQPAYEVLPAEGIFATALAVADYNKDGNLDLVVADDPQPSSGNVRLLYGDGKGTFSLGGTFPAGLIQPNALAIADVNNDGFPDVIVSSASSSAKQGGIATLINQLGTGFGPPIRTNLLPGTPIKSLAVTDVNQDGLADILVTTGVGAFTADNSFLYIGNGDGTFGSPVPYLSGTAGIPTPNPSYLVVTPSPLLRATTFVQGGNLIQGNLVSNGGFEKSDLSGESGNLNGWTTFREVNPNTGSHGQWDTQTGLTSPLSGVAVPTPPQGNYQAMLDQADLIPIAPGVNPPGSNVPADYAGTNVLYQNITIPQMLTSINGHLEVELSLNLYLDSFASFSDGSQNPSLDYQSSLPDQQVRIDIMDANSPILGYLLNSNDPNFGGVLYTAFQTQPASGTSGTLVIDKSTDPTNVKAFDQSFADLMARIAGTTVRLRIAAVNNQGKLIVGVDNVHLNATFTDTAAPIFAPGGTPHIQNVGYMAGGVPFTTDPTIVGRVADNGGVNNIAYVEFDPYTTGFQGPPIYKRLTLDPLGNFSFSVPSLLPGTYNLQFAVVSRATLADGITPLRATQTVTFGLQGPSVTQFQATGPNGIDVSGQAGVDYSSVSGRVTAIAADSSDKSGNTYYVGSANGGIWKTTNGGSSWTPLTDFIKDANGNPVEAAIGAMAVARTNPQIIYAGTGVADLQSDSRPGIGVLLSTNGGLTWSVVGNSGAVLGGARISKIIVDNNNPSIVYAAVAAGGSNGPGVYKSKDRGLTWKAVLTPTNMFLNAGGTVAAGTNLASATDLVLDPFDDGRLLVGLGNMGLQPGASAATMATAGVWTTDNGGGSWFQVLGNDNAVPNSALPSGPGVGRVTLGIGTVRVANESTVYVLISNPPVPANNVAPKVDQGVIDQTATSGLYKTSNGLLNFTKVMLSQNIGTKAAPNFVPISLGIEGSNAYGLAVDPTNPNVVYVGGSLEFQNLLVAAKQPLVHALIRVDTGDMRDATTVSNDGNDSVKAAAGGANEGVYWYDIVENVSGGTSPLQLLPPDIHALAFDAQGRLLIGTNGGIWRGEDRGFGYDFTSGGTGKVPAAFSAPGMDLTAINGNLQITGLTSVAIDPTTAGTYYTTQFGTGSAQSASILSWVSSHPTGPADPTKPNVPNSSLGIPNGEVVLAATTPPNAAPGTPSTLYRMWQFADTVGVVPERSTDGGLSWTAITSGIPISNNPAGMFPALALNPTLVPNNSQFFDELLLGTQQVFRTRSNGAQWTPISNPLTNGTDFITALGIAPSKFDVYYAGTTNGEIFVTQNAGMDKWPLRVSAPLNAPTLKLPTATVNQITVDPTNPNTAIVVFGAGVGALSGKVFPHVWETTDGGMSWQNISSNLPTVNANASVIDRRPALDAPTGKIYVATDVGVYVTIDNGKSWVRVGNSLPQAPVVGLQLSQSQDVLAAAAQGRGIFTLSTAQISPIADQIIDTDPNTPGHMSTTGPLAFSINAIGVAANGFGVTATSSNQAIVPNANIVVAGSGTDRTVTVTPVPGTNTFSSGPVAITIMVTDQFNQTFNKTFLITVLGNLVIRENTPRSFVIGIDPTTNVIGSSTDQSLIPNNNIVISVANGDRRTVTITPAVNAAGTLFVSLNLTGSNGIQTSKTFAVDVSTPVVTLPFTDTFTRPDNPFLGTAWTVLNGSIPVKHPANTPDDGSMGFGQVTTQRALAVVDGVIRADVTLQVKATLPVDGSQVGLVARQSGAGDTNEYVGRLRRSGNSYFAEILRFDNGTATPLASTDVTAFPGVGATTTLQFAVIGVSLKLYVGTGANNLGAFATDSTYVRGSIGVRGSLNTTIDNFMASDVPVAAPTLPDDFSTSSASSQLDANWEDRFGNFSVAAGMAQANQGGADLTVLRGADYANVVVSADINLVAGQRAGLLARYQGNGDNTTYLGEIDDRTGTPVAKIALSTGPNNYVILNSSTMVPGLTGNLRFVANGNSLQLFLGNTLLTFATDTTLTQGSVGIRGNATTTFDNFNATAAPTAQASLGFTDPFAPTADGQLQAVWQVRRGDFQVNGGMAVGQDPQPSDASPNNPAKINLAVLAGLGAATDVDVNAVVNVGPSQQAGLVLRYVDDRDYYLGTLDTSSGAAMAQIFINRSGVLTPLAPAVAAPSNVGMLDFQAVGGILQLSLNGTLLTTVTNDALRAGSVGIRSSNTSFANFSVSAATSVLPFMDTFSVDGPLSASWATVYGTWVVSGGTASGQANRNEAILPGVNSTDVVVFADVNVLAGQIAGLVARYSGTGDANNYLGMLDNTGGSPLAQIFYVDATGTYNKIAEAPATGIAGTLRFEVVGSSLRLFLNGTPQVAALNTALTQGAVGMRGSATTTFDNFNAMAAPAVLPYADNFSNAGPALTNNWLNEVGNFTVNGTNATGAGNANSVDIASIPGANVTDVILSLDVNVGSGQQAGLIARHLSIGNSSYYLGRIFFPAGGSPRAQILRIYGGVQSTLADVPATGVVANTFQTLRFEVVGSSLRLFFANTLQTFVTDTTRTNGSVGMRTSNTSVDNFSATAYVPASAGAGFSDNFNTAGSQPLASTWATRVGDFTVTGGVANGLSTSVNLAVLGGVSVADVNLSVDVALAAGQNAGLVAHYNGFGDNSMYIAMLDNTSGTPVARIIRVSSNGTQTVLASAAAPAATGKLHFQIVGSSLRLLLGAALLVDVTDFNPLAAGSVGIRGSATTFDNFAS